MQKILELLYFMISVIIAFGVIIGSKKPKLFILAMIIITISWQGGIWIPFLKTDITVSYFLIIVLFIYILSTSSKKIIVDRFVLKLLIPLIGMILCSLIAAFGAEDSALALGGTFLLILNSLLLLCIIGTVEKPQDIVYFLKILFIALVFQSFLAIIQYKFRFFKLGIIDQASSGFWWRTRGTFWHSNQFGMYLLFVIPFVFRYLIIVAKQQKIKSMIIYIIVFLLGGFSLYTSQNRGSWIGLGIGLMISLFLDLIKRQIKYKKAILRVSFILVVLVGLSMIYYGGRIYNRFFGGYHDVYKQAEGRDILVEESIPRIKESLPFGIGMANYRSEIWPGEFVHNLYLLIAAEIGVGLFFFIWILFVLFFETIRALRIKNYFINNIGSAFFAAILGFLISSWVGPDWFVSDQVRMNFWIITGFFMSTLRIFRKLQKQKKILTTKTVYNV